MPADRLRIAYVVHDCHRHGGQARYVAELSTRFRQQHDVYVFANTFEVPDSTGITFHPVPAWRRNSLSTILTFVLPATLAVGSGFDIVHAQGLCGLRHNVVTAHFCQAAWLNSQKQQHGSLNWKQRLTGWLTTPLERFALTKSGTRRVIAISGKVQDDLARHYHRRRGVQTIYHGVDLGTFHSRNRGEYREVVRRELGIPTESFLALFVGNLQKGAAAAIRAMATVPSAFLVLVSGSDSTSDRALSQTLGVAERVRFVPCSREVAKYYAAADAFLYPTPYDTFGLVITEAMASGLPVITSRAAGAAELIDHGKTGWLTNEPGNVDEIAAGLRQFEADTSLRDRIGTAAREKVEAYNWDRTAAETMAVYREVVASR